MISTMTNLISTDNDNHDDVHYDENVDVNGDDHDDNHDDDHDDVHDDEADVWSDKQVGWQSDSSLRVGTLTFIRPSKWDLNEMRAKYSTKQM